MNTNNVLGEKMSTDIVIIPKESAMTVFTAEKGLDPYLQVIRAEIDSFKPDVTTKKGRDAIASIAHKVAKSKVALDNVGKDLVTELKDIPRKVDAERKRMRDLLDDWKDEVRRPLTEWEQAEESRIAGHKAGIEWFSLREMENSDLAVSELTVSIQAVEGKVVDESWEEFESEAHRAKDRALTSLRAALTARVKYEAEQAELARLRAEAEAAAKRQREEAIARAAAERATREAEEKAEQERLAAQAKADKERREAEEAVRREREAAERREFELKLAAERAEREKLEAIQKAERAAQEERQKIENERMRAEAEEIARESDKKHKAAVNNAAVNALVAAGLNEQSAKAAIVAIAKGLIPGVKISY